MQILIITTVITIFSSAFAFACGLLLIWQAPRSRVNQLMAGYMMVTGILLVNNGIIRLGLIIPQLETFATQDILHIQLYLLPTAMFLLFTALVYYAPIFTARGQQMLFYGNGALLLVFWVIITIDPKYAVANFGSITYLPLGQLDMQIRPLLGFMQVVALLWLLIATFITWRARLNLSLRIACLLTLAVIFIDIIPALQNWNITSIVGVIARILFTYAILEDKLFRPLEIKNEQLIKNKSILENAYEQAESEVLIHTQALEKSLERERDMAQRLELALANEAGLSRLKSQIIEVVSHEFRTPLTIINSAAELLHRHGSRMDERKTSMQYHKIHDAVFYLTDLLQDVTMVDDMHNNVIRPQLKDIPWNSLCEQLEVQVQADYKERSILSFNYDSRDIILITDFYLVRRIVFNLLSNAVKYSSDTTPIIVTLTLDVDHFYISMTDNGIGIPADEIDKIFNIFYRASNVEARRGLGLGLHIVRKIARVLGGSVTAKSAGIDQGCTMFVKLPIDPES